MAVKFSKREVGYEDPAKKADHCADCRHFEGPRACEIVAGDISPDAWCKKFAAKSAKKVSKKSATAIYVIRHGRTALDDTHRADGWLDLPLSDEGRQQIVQVLADYLRDVPITCIYCAPLKRTEETAHILQAIPSHPEIEVAPEAMTWHLGDVAGSPKKANKAIVKYLLMHRGKKAPNGESYDDFTDRFDPWVDKMKEDAEKEGPILLVLSGSNCRRISECLFDNREMLDMDEAGLFVMKPTATGWTAQVIVGHRDDDDRAADPEIS